MVEAGAGGLKYSRHFVNAIEVLHVAHIDIDPADVVHGPAGLLNGGFDVFADLSGLRLDIADAGNAAVGATRSHAGNENQPAARFGRDGLRKMSAGLANFF